MYLRAYAMYLRAYAMYREGGVMIMRYGKAQYSTTPVSTHRYLTPITRKYFTLVFWRWEGGSNPLKVVFGTCSNATCSWAAKVRAKNATPGAQTPNPGHVDQYGGCSSRCRGQVWPLLGYRARLSTLKTKNLTFLPKLSQIAISGISLVRVHMESNPCLGRLFMPITHLHLHRPISLQSGT